MMFAYSFTIEVRIAVPPKILVWRCLASAVKSWWCHMLLTGCSDTCLASYSKFALSSSWCYCTGGYWKSPVMLYQYLVEEWKDCGLFIGLLFWQIRMRHQEWEWQNSIMFSSMFQGDCIVISILLKPKCSVLGQWVYLYVQIRGFLTVFSVLRRIGTHWGTSWKSSLSISLRWIYRVLAITSRSSNADKPRLSTSYHHLRDRIWHDNSGGETPYYQQIFKAV